MDDKIIQIIPAPEALYLLYQNEEDSTNPIKNKTVCLALTDQGDILLMDIDDSGFIDSADSAHNFIGIEWEGLTTKKKILDDERW